MCKLTWKILHWRWRWRQRLISGIVLEEAERVRQAHFHERWDESLHWDKNFEIIWSWFVCPTNFYIVRFRFCSSALYSSWYTRKRLNSNGHRNTMWVTDWKRIMLMFKYWPMHKYYICWNNKRAILEVLLSLHFPSDIFFAAGFHPREVCRWDMFHSLSRNIKVRCSILLGPAWLRPSCSLVAQSAEMQTDGRPAGHGDTDYDIWWWYNITFE